MYSYWGKKLLFLVSHADISLVTQGDVASCKFILNFQYLKKTRGGIYIYNIKPENISSKYAKF